MVGTACTGVLQDAGKVHGVMVGGRRGCELGAEVYAYYLGTLTFM